MERLRSGLSGLVRNEVGVVLMLVLVLELVLGSTCCVFSPPPLLLLLSSSSFLVSLPLRDIEI